jgi:hypothetical protein
MTQCNKCKLFVSMTKDEVVKCKGVCGTVYHKKCVQKNKQFLQTAVCDDCQKPKSSPVQPGQSPKLSLNLSEDTGEKVLVEVNKTLEVTLIYNVQKKIVDLTTSVEFYAEMYQKLIEYKGESEKRIKALENRNVYLEKYNKALEERVQELEIRE